MLIQFLQQHGFSVESAKNGNDGLARALSEPFDLVILDVMLPGLDGFEALKQLRAHSGVPVLMLTARGDRGDRVRGLDMGADDYLPKPFDPEELHARIRAILRRVATSHVRNPEVLQVGELRLLPGTRDAYFRSKRLGLTAMECEILEQLMRSCGRVVSRDEISQQLYNREASAFDRAVDTHVTRIRRKLGEGRSMIISVRGTGYQLCPPDPAVT